jgi:hypothetical protein
MTTATPLLNSQRFDFFIITRLSCFPQRRRHAATSNHRQNHANVNDEQRSYISAYGVVWTSFAPECALSRAAHHEQPWLREQAQSSLDASVTISIYITSIAAPPRAF